jgi:hypothetical protein
MTSTNNTFDIDTDVNSYTNDELLQILELDSGSGALTADDIRDKVQLMMRQYPSIAFFFAQVGERLESEYADADDVAGEEEQQDEEDEAKISICDRTAPKSSNSTLLATTRFRSSKMPMDTNK